MTYDPELDLLYIGSGNGVPWSEHARSPQGGDNLYTSSIVALQPDSGMYVWHYQELPATFGILILPRKLESSCKRLHRMGN